jgi:hypothetical protein
MLPDGLWQNMKGLKVFTLCDCCSKEFELLVGDNGFSIGMACPHCAKFTIRWIKIIREKKVKD